MAGGGGWGSGGALLRSGMCGEVLPCSVASECCVCKAHLGRPILPSISPLEHWCFNVLCCGMLSQVYGCLAVGPFVCILLGSSLPAGSQGMPFAYSHASVNDMFQLVLFYASVVVHPASSLLFSVVLCRQAWGGGAAPLLNCHNFHVVKCSGWGSFSIRGVPE